MRPLIIMNGEKIDWFHTVIRMLMYLAGVAVLALGMSLQTASGLGVAALTCFATTLSMLTGKTLGFWITATYVAYIVAQFTILRREFQPRILLELCFSTLPGTGELICIKRGESGYYPSDWNTNDPTHNQELADYNNERLRVTREQRLAMECGSMHGWGVPGADPSYYEQKMGGMKFG